MMPGRWAHGDGREPRQRSPLDDRWILGRMHRCVEVARLFRTRKNTTAQTRPATFVLIFHFVSSGSSGLFDFRCYRKSIYEFVSRNLFNCLLVHWAFRLLATSAGQARRQTTRHWQAECIDGFDDHPSQDKWPMKNDNWSPTNVIMIIVLRSVWCGDIWLSCSWLFSAWSPSLRTNA